MTQLKTNSHWKLSVLRILLVLVLTGLRVLRAWHQFLFLSCEIYTAPEAVEPFKATRHGDTEETPPT